MALELVDINARAFVGEKLGTKMDFVGLAIDHIVHAYRLIELHAHVEELCLNCRVSTIGPQGVILIVLNGLILERIKVFKRQRIGQCLGGVLIVATRHVARV